MAKQTFMSRVKAYRKLHPRCSQVDAMKKLKGTTVSGTKRKKAVTGAPKAKRKVSGFPMVSGVTRKRKRIPAATSRARTAHTTTYSRGMAIIRKIDAMEAKYKKAKNAEERKLLATLINAEHDKLDQVQKKRKSA